MKADQKQFYVKDIKQDTSWLVIMSVISTFGVVFLHVEECFFTTSVSDNIWILYLFLHCFLVFCVPCFFLISGATLLNYRDRYDTKTYVWKRVKKTLIPFIIWTFVTMGYLFGRQIISSKDITFSYIWNALFKANNINENYWFFPYLFALYIFIPLLALVKKENKDKVYLIVILVGLVCIFIIPWILRVSDANNLSWLYGLDILGPVVFACTGYFIRNYKFSKSLNLVIIVVALLALVGMCCGTYFRSNDFGLVKLEYIDDCNVYYSNILIYLYALGIAIIFKKIGSKLMKYKYINSSFTFMSKFTFSIYLTHKLIREVFRDYLYVGVGNLSSTSWIYLVTATPLIILTIVLIVWSLKKIPIVKKGMEFILP